MAKSVKEGATDYRFLMPLVLGTMMNPLNSTMLATALMSLCNSFKVSVGQGAILITSLYITSTIAQPLMGRLADIFSPKKINKLGFILAFAAALIGAFAPGFAWLIVSRILLGLGTSAAYPSAMALINRKYAAENRAVPGQVLGLIGTSAQISMVLGPVLGGLLTQWLSWKGIFLINIPWILVALYLSKAIPEPEMPENNSSEGLFKRLDVIGILLFSTLLLSLLLALMQHTFSWLLISPAVLLFVLMILWERRQENPFIDVRLLAHKPALLLVYVRAMATSYILYQMLYAMPQWIEALKRMSPAETGLMMLPESAMAFVTGLLISKSTKLFKQNLIGVTIMVVACVGWFTLNNGSSVVYILMVTLAMGVAEGTNLIANQALMNAEAPLAQKGVSAGLYRTFGYLGAIASSTQIKMLFHHGVTDYSFHIIGYTVLCSSIFLVVLLVPLWVRIKSLDRGIGAEPDIAR